MLAEKIQAANNLYTQMMMRMARAEEKIESEHNTVGSLVNHTKQVEQALVGNQQQLLSRREQITVHVERMRDDMEDMRENYEQLHKNMRALTDDVRTMKSKHEVQVVQFGTVVQELRQRIKKIEGDTSTAVSTSKVSQQLVKITTDFVDLASYSAGNLFLWFFSPGLV